MIFSSTYLLLLDSNYISGVFAASDSNICKNVRLRYNQQHQFNVIEHNKQHARDLYHTILALVAYAAILLVYLVNLHNALGVNSTRDLEISDLGFLLTGRSEAVLSRNLML